MKQVLSFLCLILFFCCTLSAQEEHFQIPDSLASKTNAELIGLIKPTRYSDPVTGKIYTKTYHKKAIAAQDKLAIIDSYFYFGHIAFLQGEYTNSISFINKGISLANTEKDSILRKLYAVRGNTYEAYGQYQEAYDDYETMLEIAKKYKDQTGIFIAETSFAKLKLNNKQYLEALKVYKKYYEMLDDTSVISKNSRISILIGLSDIYLQMEAIDSARVYIDIGYKESEALKDDDSVCYFYTYDGIYEYYKGNIEKALAYFEKAEEKVSKIQTEQKLNIEVFYYMAQCYFKLQDYQSVIHSIERAFKVIEEENSKKGKTSVKSDFVPYEYIYFLKLLSRCYEGLGDEKNQDLFWSKYSEKKSERDKKMFPINKSIYNLLNEKEENAFIARQSQRKGSAETQVEYLYYILALLCTIGIISYILYKKKDRQKTLAYTALIEKISKLETKSISKSSENTKVAKKTVSITDEKAQAILKGLEKFEAQELYLDSGCNLRFVAKKVKTNATYVSKIINKHKGISFNDYINDLRIQYTLKRLKSDTLFRAYSIKSISEEVGYKSADSFTKHFKKQTALYPSYYIKKLNQEVA